jgi:hypothetical protein
MTLKYFPCLWASDKFSYLYWLESFNRTGPVSIIHLQHSGVLRLWASGLLYCAMPNILNNFAEETVSISLYNGGGRLFGNRLPNYTVS